MPVVFKPEEINAARPSLGELPAALRGRLEADFGLPAYDADVLVNQGHAAVDYFTDTAGASGNAKSAANWVTQDVFGALKERGDLTIESFPISSKTLGRMIEMIQTGDLPSTRAAKCFRICSRPVRMTSKPQSSRSASQAVDESDLVALCEKLLAANPKTVADVKNGKASGGRALIGQAKKKNPNIDPNRVREICLEIIRTKL